MERERREATPHFERARMRRDLSADQVKKAAQFHSFNESANGFITETDARKTIAVRVPPIRAEDRAETW
jgi:hypothetical protein